MALARAMEDAIREEACRPYSPLTSLLVVRGIQESVVELRKTRDEILAAIQEGPGALEGRLSSVGVRLRNMTNFEGELIAPDKTIRDISNEYGLTLEEVLDLVRVLNPAAYARLRGRGPAVISERARPLTDAMQRLLDAVRSDGEVVPLNKDQARQIATRSPADLVEYHLARVVEWSHPRFQVDRRFVALTLLPVGGQRTVGTRWVSGGDSPHFDDLSQAMEEMDDAPVLVLLGAPGSGKSTLLRRFQLDDSMKRLRGQDSENASILVSLNGYRREPDKPLPSPLDWLAARWRSDCPELPPLAEMLSRGRVLLLLDGLNEIPHKSVTDYGDKVSLWRQFVIDQLGSGRGNRAVFSCRTLDYCAPLSSPDLPVPSVVVRKMSDEQVQRFLHAYLPAQATALWGQLKDSAQLDLFRCPYFLKLLLAQVETANLLPKGRASLFTGFVRETLRREVERGHRLLQPDALLSERDHGKLARNEWTSPVDLPEGGHLIRSLSDLAFEMQLSTSSTDSNQVSVGYDEACAMISHNRAMDIVNAGIALNVLDEGLKAEEVKYFHHLLQEFFAARRLAKTPNSELVRVEWRAEVIKPTLLKTIEALAEGDPLPRLPTTGWEETVVLAAALVHDADTFVRGVMDANLPLAARLAASPEVTLDEGLERQIRRLLLDRSGDKQADLRARIAAGEALGFLGHDPTSDLRTSRWGDYLHPQLVRVPGGTYRIGRNSSSRNDYLKQALPGYLAKVLRVGARNRRDSERVDLRPLVYMAAGTFFVETSDDSPSREMDMAEFEIGASPVTNAEFDLFVRSRGYEALQWWDTPEARDWVCGNNTSDGARCQVKDIWRLMNQQYIWEQVEELASQQRIAGPALGYWKEFRETSEPELDRMLLAQFPDHRRAQPAYWEDASYNNPRQPVVGICWYEARAYCNWLSEATGHRFRLPTEAEWEVAASGAETREFAYGGTFSSLKCNTLETHIGAPTPVGVFPDGATPQGCFDMTGNVYEWTSSCLKRYPYDANDGRERTTGSDRRIARGGSWAHDQEMARNTGRNAGYPSDHGLNADLGFRVVRCRYDR
ncbi:MAG: SUMF1/EgtB/PvdO family nonheme iron enzyme [Acidobacteriota bacterium]